MSDKEGPIVAAPVGALVATQLGALALVGVGAWALLGAVQPDGREGVPGGVGVVGAAFTLSMVAIRVWRARRVLRWVHAFMAGHGLRLLVTVALTAWLLYSSPPSARLSAGLVVVAGYMASLVAESFVFSRAFRGGSGAAPSGCSAEESSDVPS